MVTRYVPIGRQLRVATLVAATVLLIAAPGGAQDLSYLREMPPASRVVADYAGGDAMTERARQIAALTRLFEMVGELAGNRYVAGPFPNPEEQRLRDAYGAEAGRLRAQAVATFAGQPTGMQSPRTQWSFSIDRLERSASFRRELLNRYFSQQVQGRYRAALAQRQALQAEGRNAISQGLKDLSGETDGTWDAMSEEERAGATAFGAVMLGLLAFGVIRELRPFAITTSSAPAVRYGFGRARLHWATGVVTDYHATDKTTSTLWERREATGRITEFWTSTTFRHEEFDLVHTNGRHHVHTVHATAAGSTVGEFDRLPGQPLTAVWATPRWRKRGPYLLFRQPGGLQDLAVSETNRNIARLLSPRMWTVLPALGLGFVIGSSTDVLADFLGATSSNLRGLAATAIAACVWFVVYLSAAIVRRRRFESREMPRLRALIDAAPQSPA